MRIENTSKVEIRFNDIDVFGHVNNAIYLSLFEQGRIAYFDKLLGKNHNWKEYGIVLGNAQLNYKAPIYWGNEVFVKVWCSQIGTKSFTLNYSVFKPAENNSIHEFCNGSTLMVCFNYNTLKSIEIPESWKNGLL